MKNVLSNIKTFIFGRRVKGEKVSVPSLRTVNSNTFMTFNMWTNKVWLEEIKIRPPQPSTK
jgi:hypothetical protein